MLFAIKLVATVVVSAIVVLATSRLLTGAAPAVVVFVLATLALTALVVAGDALWGW